MVSIFFLKMLCLLVFNQENISCLLVVREKQEKNRVSEYMGSQIWEAEDKVELRLVMLDREGRLGQVFRPGLPAAGRVWRRPRPCWSVLGAWTGRPVRTRTRCCSHSVSVLGPREAAVAALRRFTTTSSYSFCVSNPSVMLLLSSNLGNTTAM